ncbi:MAG TPA: methyltransferase domain-containing protein [Ktedonobacteraceae bacterium]|nr:methyltransferase domain-containing protein [Ktedonobacteraceae bacterium]
MLEELYTSGNYLKKNPTWHVGESPWKAREIMRMIARNKLEPETICEVGCGAGEILRLLQQNMHEKCTFWGYEISPQAYELCTSRTNDKLHFKLCDFTQEKEVFFDLILVMDVIEHLENYFNFLREIQPRSTYKIFQFPLDLSVRSILRNHVVKYRTTYGHIHYFTKDIALQMLKDLGYEVIDYFYTYETIEAEPVPYEKNFLIRVKKRLGKIKRGLLKSGVKLCFAMNEDLAARIFGRWRFMVLAK